MMRDLPQLAIVKAIIVSAAANPSQSANNLNAAVIVSEEYVISLSRPRSVEEEAIGEEYLSASNFALPRPDKP